MRLKRQADRYDDLYERDMTRTDKAIYHYDDDDEHDNYVDVEKEKLNDRYDRLYEQDKADKYMEKDIYRYDNDDENDNRITVSRLARKK